MFFIYAMLSMAVHRGLPVMLPLSTTAKVDKQLLLSVTLKGDGTVYVNKEQVSLNSLTQVLAEKSRAAGDSGVLLFADRSLPYQQLFRVLDRIRQAGLNRISLQAEVDEKQ